MVPELPDTHGLDERLRAVLLEFLESSDRGVVQDRAALVADHPEFKPELQDFLDTWVRVEGLTEPIRSTSQALRAAAISAQFPASRAAESRVATVLNRSEPGNVEESEDHPAGGPNKVVEEKSGWLGRWLRQQPPLIAQHYPFLNVSQPRTEIGRLGPYRLLEVIGSGGMGVVFRGEDVQLRRPVAVKVLRADLASDRGSRERFLREARSAAAVDHEHVISVYHVGEEAGVPFLGMQWLKGMNLEELLRRVGRLEVPLVLRLGRQITLGLAAAHGHGLLHRDIKPANLWIEHPEAASSAPGVDSKVASAGRVKILDFGLARADGDDGHLTRSGATVGTPAYMAPEQAAGNALDARSDLFAVGVVLYRMCTGRFPFPIRRSAAGSGQPAAEPPPSVRDLNPAVSSGLSDLVMELLASDPACRPASAAEVAERLQALECREAAPAAMAQPVATPSTLPVQGPSGRRAWRGCAAAVALGVAVLLPLGWLFGGIVVRFATNRGEVIIAVDDPDTNVTVKEAGAVIADQKGERRIILTAGDHELEVTVRDPRGEFRFFTKSFVLRRGGTEIVNVHQAVTPDELSPADEVIDLDRAAAIRALALAGKVTYRAGNRDAEIRSKNELPAEAFHLTGIDLSDTGANDADLARLGAVPELDFLRLSRTQVGNGGLAHLSGLGSLRVLALDSTRVSDAGLAHLSKLTGLVDLELSNTSVTDAGLAHLEKLTGMQVLNLGRTRVTDAGLAQLGAMNHLRKLYLNGTKVSDAGVARMVRRARRSRLPPLTLLDLSGTRVSATGAAAVKGILPVARIEWWEPNRRAAEAVLGAGGSVHVRTGGRGSDVAVKDSAALPANYFQLTRAGLVGTHKPSRELLLLLAALTDFEFDDFEEVDLSGSAVSDADLESLGALPCRRLVLDRAPVQGPGLVHLKKLPRLIDLSLGCPTLSFPGVRYVAELKQLERLSLASSGATDVSLKNLHDLVKLRELDLTATKVTAAGVAELQKALPKCNIKAAPTGLR
jgi:serine/threonine protein kinase